MRSKFCLNSTSSFKEINGSQTNRSRTKQTYSFSKSSRFNDAKPYCDKNTYGGQSLTLKKKPSATGIGYGNRSDFTQCLSVSPSSSKYNLKNFIDQNKDRKRGSSIGIGRDKFAFDSYVNKQVCKFPGATKYHNQKLNKQKAPIYTMRKKTKVLDKSMSIQPEIQNPGPGQYQNPQIDINRSSFSSKFNRISYSSSKSQRFGSSDNKVPGPGKYNDVHNLSSVGRYIVSSNVGGTLAKFDKTRRVTKFDQAQKASSIRPGPGYYKAPSQFGQYDGDVYRFNTVDVDSHIKSRKK